MVWRNKIEARKTSNRKRNHNEFNIRIMINMEITETPRKNGYYILVELPYISGEECSHGRHKASHCSHCRQGLPLIYKRVDGGGYNAFHYIFSRPNEYSTYCSAIKPKHVKRVSKKEVDKYITLFNL